MKTEAAPRDSGRDERLNAIAELQEQHRRKNRVESADWNGNGKHFLLLVSKGSGNLQQRANQDQAESILSKYPLEIVDESNVAHRERRDFLFELSGQEGVFPQLFLIEHQKTKFLGGFDLIEERHESDTLQAFLEDEIVKTPKLGRRSLMGKAKKIFKSKRDVPKSPGSGSPGIFKKKSLIPTAPNSARSSASPSTPSEHDLRRVVDAELMPSLPNFEDPGIEGEEMLKSPAASTRTKSLEMKSDGALPLMDDRSSRRSRTSRLSSRDLSRSNHSSENDNSMRSRSSRRHRTSGKSAEEEVDDGGAGDRSPSTRSSRKTRTRGGTRSRRGRSNSPAGQGEASEDRHSSRTPSNRGRRSSANDEEDEDSQGQVRGRSLSPESVSSRRSMTRMNRVANVHSNSPGKFRRGYVASRREAMKDIRERQSKRNLSSGQVSPAASPGTYSQRMQLRKIKSLDPSQAPGSARGRRSSVRRDQDDPPSDTEGAESLKDLCRRVRKDGDTKEGVDTKGLQMTPLMW